MADNEVLNNIETVEPDEEFETIAVDDLNRVKLGRQGENETQTVRIDCGKWLVELQGCTFMIAATRPGEREIYVPDVEVNAGVITWPIKAQDTACSGAGRAEVRAMKGDAIKKSRLFRTWIEPALDGEVGGVPTTPPNWVKETKDALERANALMADAVADAEAATQAAENLFEEVDVARDDALQAIRTARADAMTEAGASIDAIDDARDAATQAITDAQASAVADAATAMDEAKDSAVAAAEAAMADSRDAKMEEIGEIRTNAEQIAGSAVTIAQNANLLATQALEKATTAENDSAEHATDIEQLKGEVNVLKLQIADRINGGFVSDGVGYFTADGRVVFEMTGMGGGGSGGGGDDSGSNSKITMTNTSGWMSKTIAQGDSCPVTFRWTSLENELPTGNGSLRVSVNDSVQAMLEVGQGDVSVDVADYLKAGANMVDLTVYDIYGKNRSIRVTISVVELTLASSFDASAPYNGAIAFPYTPVGNVRKVVHFVLDGEEIGTVNTSVSGHQQSFTIPQQSHGSHALRVWFTAEINGQTVKSNELYYEIICLDPLDTTPIIVSGFDRSEATQYETLMIEYNVYDPMNMMAPVSIEVNGEVVSTLTADRTTQTFTHRVSGTGELNIDIISGSAVKRITLQVAEADVHPEAVTDQLSLHLDAAGRSNSENDPAIWTYGDGDDMIAAAFSGFNWTRDGWVIDENGLTTLRTMGGSAVEIPAMLYGRDFRATGKTIEIEFATHNVLDYDTPIISCMSGNRGFEICADHAIFKSARAEVACRYTTDRRMRLTLAVQPQSAERLVYLYIDGEYQSISQYSGTDTFMQADPVGITIGSALCGADIYSIRVYDRYLTADEILGNFIADRQDVWEMLRLYRANDVFDDHGSIVANKLPKELPYAVIAGIESPQYKGDKKTVAFDYYEPTNDARRLTADGVVVNVQGTSSQYYAVKNLKITFKNGATVNGRLVAGFTIRDGAIMVDTFTLKADVASSESANNIVLAKLYDDMARKLGITTPPQKKNSAVRQGVDGFPCVVFWDYGDGAEFMGKYNFNNDKGTFDTFGFGEGDEIWDVRSNTSQLSKFHTNVFSDDWCIEDYEAIYPEEYTGQARMKAMTDFLFSTWQAAATGEALDAPETYGGVEYTADTAEYRLARYKAIYPEVYDLDNAAFYYVFTLVMLMVDSRQKNEHLAWWAETGKWWELIYDCDTALGTDNRGGLAFEYWMEDTDAVNGENVFNGADNVKWENFRQAFWEEARAMYQRMRSSGLFSAAFLKELFHSWQAAWPKAVWNEDGDFKYVAPLRKDGTTTYLPMAQGSKQWQRDEFLEWRIPYCDSMFDMADALLSIMFRPYYQVTEQQRAAGDVDITVDVYKKSYVTVLWDDTKVSHRVIDGTSCRVENPLSYANDAVCAIHNGKMIKDVHGLEKLYVGFWDSTNAPNLQAVRLGSGEAGYRNEATKTVSVGANQKLREVDLRGCVNFGTDTQKTLDLAHCPNIAKVYLDGTAALGVDLPNGGVLEELHLPATTSSIVLRNQPKLTDAKLVVEGWNEIDQLWLEGMTGLDTKAILRQVPAATAVRITGFYWTCADANEIDGIFDLLDTMRGVDINGQGQGVEVEKAQMSGTIHTATLTGAQIAGWKQRYPSINVTADHTTSVLTLKSWDGETTIQVIACQDGAPTEALPAVPARANTAQYSYTPVGWSRSMDAQTAESDAAQNVAEDRTIYAAYSRAVRSYAITWANDNNSTLATENYPYGATPSYKGSTPVSAIDSSKPFTHWTPEIAAVTGTQTYKASYIPIYTVTFVLAAEDGGGTLYTAEFQDGETVTYGGSAPTSTREGYTFNGWNPALDVIHRDTTYTAKFKAPIDAPTAKTADGAYGVEWDYSQPATTLTRKGLAAGFAAPAPATTLAGSGTSPFDSIAPWKDMKRYNVIGTELVPDTDSRFDEAANDTVVYIPEFYYTAWKDTENSKWLWAISPTALAGYRKHPGSGCYVGRFHTSGDATAVFSRGGVTPLGNVTRANFRTYSKAKGDDWRQMDLKTWSAIQMLYLVEFANWNSQETLGTSLGSSEQNTGATTGAAYHTIKRSDASNAYRWIENPFSNVYTWVDGFVASSRNSYISIDPAGYGDTTSDMEATDIRLPYSGMISGLGYSEKCAWAFIPDTATGSDATYVTDRMSSGSGTCIPYVGGSNANANYGMFFFDASCDVNGKLSSIGSRLVYETA